MTRSFGAAILGCAGPVLAPAEAAFFRDYQPFGFILFARNVETRDQVTALCADLRAAVGWDAPILIDQEGGRVQRLRAPLAREWVPPLDEVARHGPRAARAMVLRSRLIARDMRALGIDTICAPLIDVARPDTHAVLRNRCYSDDPNMVAGMALAVAEGLCAGGALPVVKHLPGLGRAGLDSHLELPQTEATLEDLHAVDFRPVQQVAGLPLAMTAHVVYECLDDLPATQSPRILNMLRQTLGVTGLLMTDDISMEALSGTVAERGLCALNAGCDVVLHCNGDLPEMRSIAMAIGQMSPRAQTRAEAALEQRPKPDLSDAAPLIAEWEALERVALAHSG
ncbi:MAG: glycoside hydrolase family 3 N-terminal domain-containing protein [Primorskyibacter sp.]